MKATEKKMGTNMEGFILEMGRKTVVNEKLYCWHVKEVHLRPLHLTYMFWESLVVMT